MQLDRLEAFHKALGDKNRLRIVAILQRGARAGGELAEQLQLKHATVSHHLHKLKDVGLVYQRRDRNTIYYHLHERRLEQMAVSVTKIGLRTDPELFVSEEEKAAVLQSFLHPDGTVKALPAKHKKRLVVLAYLSEQLTEKTYTEAEMNQVLAAWYEDTASLRRELIMNHFFYREKGYYERNPKEMWVI
ncbi:metalloregulator ArsR/SmtB family transcription factor [Alkalicoccus urumqiensis]|uniref:ArsR family transcriptional regulator n=1 Tax=Alkalicoccus urumqiensis TaxID=1548213 RepID=A0A2P6MJD0_ALKUR|nr:metalloregulator ArsR/SmtB family transcription factor [Alkalicoccus urumqiensis]PRO66387.1 ArsR family transcriptional regulator [Alkalicoccus urumqiensis]